MLEESAKEKDAMLQKKLKTVGNYVHDSVPISNNEVRLCSFACHDWSLVMYKGRQRSDPDMGT